MAYSITTKDGITINDIPDDVSPDSPELKAKVAAIRAGGGAAALEAPATAPQAPTQQKQPGFFAGLAEQITGRERATPETQTLPEWTGMPELNQMSMASLKSAIGTLATNPKETVQILQSNFPGIQVRQDEKGNYLLRSSLDQKEYAIPPGVSVGDIPRILGGMLAFTPAGRGTSLVGMGLKSGATQAAIEGSQAAAGGEFSPQEVAITAAGAPILPGLAKIPGVIKSLSQPIVDPLKGALEAAERSGIRVMTSDAVRPETFIGKTAQQTSERIPIAGTGPVRAAQQAERVSAVKNLFSEYGVTGAEDFSQDIISDVVSKRSGLLTKYTSMKNDVFNRLDNKGTVPLNKTVQKIDDEMNRLSSVAGSQPLIGKLQELKVTLQNNPNISSVEANRKVIGDWMSDQGLASIKTEANKVAKNIYAPLKDDMTDFISANGARNDLTKWKVANKRLAESIGDLENTAFKSAINKADANPEQVLKLLLSNKPSDSAMLYKSLTPDGRDFAKAAIVNQIANKAGVPDATVAGGKIYSPEAFRNELERLGPSVKSFFKGEDLKQLEGLSKAITLTQRASQAGVSPATGAQAVPFLAASGLGQMFSDLGFLESMLASTATAATIGGAARVYESAPVRNAMIKLAQSPANTPKEAIALNKLILTIQQMEREKQE